MRLARRFTPGTLRPMFESIFDETEIRNAQGQKIDYRWHPAAHPVHAKHCVVIGHGVTANLDRPFVKALAEGLAAQGIHALRFSFSGNGDSEGRFQDSCITREVADLDSVLSAVQAKGFSLSYAGHSMGGAVGVLKTATDPRIRHFISLAGMVRPREFAETEFGTAVPDEGFMWDDTDCPLSSTFMNDLKAIESLVPAIANVKVPALFVYGVDDDLVPLAHGREIFAAANEPKMMAELQGSNHVFAGDATPRMVFMVTEWMKSRLAAMK